MDDHTWGHLMLSDVMDDGEFNCIVFSHITMVSGKSINCFLFLPLFSLIPYITPLPYTHSLYLSDYQLLQIMIISVSVCL